LLWDARGREHNSFKIDRAIIRPTQATNATPQSQSDKKSDERRRPEVEGSVCFRMRRITMVKDITRRSILPGAVVLGTVGWAGRAFAGDAPEAAIAGQQEHQGNKSIGRYIGTPASRVDGRAKVTGTAKYAAEFKSPGLAHGSVVASTIAKGRILRIDTSQALRVPGVIDVLTHQHRPHMADTDDAYKDDVAPDGTPFRPLYDNRSCLKDSPSGLARRGMGDRALRHPLVRGIRKGSARHGPA
jgi:hypothetical protein